MKTTFEIAAAQDFPTHRLTVLLGKEGKENKTKEFFFSAKEAVFIAETMNDLKTPNFVFGASTPFVQCVPKFGAVLEMMTAEEVKNRHLKYFEMMEKTKIRKEERQKDEEMAIREEWIAKNPEAWKKFLEDGRTKCDEDFGKNSGSFFDSLPENRKNSIYKNQARIFLKNTHFPTHL